MTPNKPDLLRGLMGINDPVYILRSFSTTPAFKQKIKLRKALNFNDRERLLLV